MKLIDAASNNDLELVKKLISDGYPLNNKNVFGETALMMASWYRDKEIIKELIKACASLDIISIYGDTVLDYNKEIWKSYEIQDLILTMYPDKYNLIEEKVGIHKDILLKLKMEQILSL